MMNAAHETANTLLCVRQASYGASDGLLVTCLSVLTVRAGYYTVSI